MVNWFDVEMNSCFPSKKLVESAGRHFRLFFLEEMFRLDWLLS
ncbi:hypothetical protein SPHINGO8BC_50731 [Sphingobacterium multivorum]|uniref:Uncharacterized protein n=1 Tax=Sphingobacterium multivorum TaxID=28454 RepID=A0A654CEM6_SPHMU|nr:hypothetical protein SPHINGO8BC_50731 [Sphingobacterium multivorum]